MTTIAFHPNDSLFQRKYLNNKWFKISFLVPRLMKLLLVIMQRGGGKKDDGMRPPWFLLQSHVYWIPICCCTGICLRNHDPSLLSFRSILSIHIISFIVSFRQMLKRSMVIFNLNAKLHSSICKVFICDV